MKVYTDDPLWHVYKLSLQNGGVSIRSVTSSSDLEYNVHLSNIETQYIRKQSRIIRYSAIQNNNIIRAFTLLFTGNFEESMSTLISTLLAACGHRNCLNKVRQGTQRPLWMRAIQRAMIFLSKRFRFDISVRREYVLLRQFYTHLNVMWRKTKLHAEEQKRIYLAEKAPWILLRRNNSGTSQIPLSAWKQLNLSLNVDNGDIVKVYNMNSLSTSKFCDIQNASDTSGHEC
ncbi:hypothetical protein GJ496_011332 [Pomphorhynchus laevis]|nr:hypothetical protein GJ496_011332 [Pomphorhynchus laevis]